MTQAICLTMRALATSRSEHAAPMLLKALDVPHAGVQVAAVDAIAEYCSPRTQIELIRHFRRLSPEAQEQLVVTANNLAGPLRKCLTTRSDASQDVMAILEAGTTGNLLPLVAQCLSEHPNFLDERMVSVFRVLVDRVHDQLRTKSTDPRHAAAMQVRHASLAALNLPAATLTKSPYRDAIVEAILILGQTNDEAVRLVLGSGSEIRQLVFQFLQTSTHPGVMDLTLQFLNTSRPPLKVFEILGKRSDPEFIAATLRWVRKSPTTMQARNLQQIESLPWLDAPEEVLPLLPEALQPAVLTLLSHVAVADNVKERVREWILRNGTFEARDSVLAGGMPVNGDSVREIVADALNSEEPQSQAWALTQVRQQRLPDALEQLVNGLDSTADVVREAAREELSDFDLQRILASYDRFDEDHAERAGQLVLKIDPQATEQLAKEFFHPIRQRRIRAITGSVSLGLHWHVLPTLLELLNDNDEQIRRVVVETLAEMPVPSVVAALQQHRGDPNIRVREAIDSALSQLAGLVADDGLEVPSQTVSESASAEV
ncbi:HEAT repeat domain-containing protein [Thalassoroseus pseudoceratinae]|uniref:HEAT repeat domain-containing protein n=1 Tax=Thalassoroseus pseudoceratinae TaxID=2713176 RepID=UPI0014227384|nr:HEAT repeat domain-containing protein [Thalassoroseus pseudoceratinae]